MEITLDFCEKRIQEQKDYIENIMQQALDKKISMDRSLEIIKSAEGVGSYFLKKKHEILGDFKKKWNEANKNATHIPIVNWSEEKVGKHILNPVEKNDSISN